jgi:hypothetical protein
MDGLIDCNPNVELRLIEAFSSLSGVGSAYRIGGRWLCGWISLEARPVALENLHIFFK